MSSSRSLSKVPIISVTLTSGVRSTILPSAISPYDLYADMLHGGYVRDSVKVARSRLWGEKRIVDPVFAFCNTTTGVVQKYFVRVDVSNLFPMT